MTLVRRSPLEDLMSLPRVMDRMLDETFFRPGHWFVRETDEPALDLHSTPEAVIIEAALPGLKPEDVEISLEAELLTLKGSFRREEHKEEAGYLYRELSRGEFVRTVPLPVPVRPEEARAVFKDGMLTLTMPKAAETKSRKVEITVS